MSFCPDGSRSPLPDPEYVIQGVVSGCDAIYRVRLIAEFWVSGSGFVGSSSSFINIAEAITDPDGGYILEFDWCAQIAPLIHEDIIEAVPTDGGYPSLYGPAYAYGGGIGVGNTQVTSSLRGFYVRVHDPVTDKFLSSVEVDLVSNSSFLDVELPVDSFCNDRVEAYSLQATQAVRAGSLVAGRRTVVRLYANPVRSSQGVLANIPARLRGFRNGAELPESPLDPVMVAINVDPSDTHRMVLRARS